MNDDKNNNPDYGTDSRFPPPFTGGARGGHLASYRSANTCPPLNPPPQAGGETSSVHLGQQTPAIISKNYDPKEAEPRWQAQWEKRGVYRWNADEPRANNYVIDTPPPTVSGLLHMGHIFSYTQADFIARFQRMRGMNVFYPMGFDDNGLPTERLVEKVKKIRATDLPREEFIKVCQEVVSEAEEEFRALFKSIALSVDWNQEYQTISEHSRRLSQLSFLDLFKQGEVYRKFEPTLWDAVDRTALAQADVEDKEMPGVFYDLAFTIDGESEVIIATTRPELLAACVAVMFNPDDERYRHLHGRTAITPVFGVPVPFLADDKVSIDKGTGLVMCCTFGDQTDVEWWKRHNLPLRVILDKAGRIGNLDDLGVSNDWPSRLDSASLAAVKSRIVGLKVQQARASMVEILKEQGLVRAEKAITHAVKCAERSGAPLEILVTPQWFIRLLDKKEALLEKVRIVEWRPDFMRLRAEQWINGLSWDWCISRQRYFGVPFPVWYISEAGSQKPEVRIIVADESQLPVNPLTDLPHGYKLIEKQADNTFLAVEEASGLEVIIIPDFDVMDTWATSSITPQLSSHAISTTGSIEHPQGESGISRHSKLFPADLRPQAHEIIRTWAFYTIAKAHLHQDSIPWKNAMISGWCLASDKTKMSKSKGNVVTPVDLIRDKGADAVRYWASTSRLGMDTAFSEDLLKIGKKLVNKLWNAASFVRQFPAPINGTLQQVTETLDLWALSRLHLTIKKATEAFNEYEYCDARVYIEDFFWNDFCDNYLELVKTRAYGEQGFLEDAKNSAIITLNYCLDTLLRLFAPFVPHVTEEIWQGGQSIHSRGNWPDAGNIQLNHQAEAAGRAAVSILEVVRGLKSERKVSIKAPLTELIICPARHTPELETVFADLKAAANSEGISVVTSPPAVATATSDGLFKIAAIFKES